MDAMGTEPAQEIHGASCHSKPSQVESFVPVASGMMTECPLGVNATAAISKSSAYLSEPARGPVAALPSFEKQTLQAEYPRSVPFLHNRGSTHLHCSVLLI